MNVPHHLKIDGSGSHLDISIRADDTQHPRLSRVGGRQEGDLQHAQQRMGYSDIHPEWQRMHLTGDKDTLDQFAQAASDMDPSHDRVTLPLTAFIHLAQRHPLR